MSRRILVPVALLTVFLTAPAAAQERPFPYVLGSRDAVLLPVGLGLSLLGYHFTQGYDPLTAADIAPLTPDDINAFDRPAARSWSPSWGDASDWTLNALLGGAVLSSFVPPAREGRWRNTVTLGTMFAESYLLVTGVTYNTKGLAGRKRPFVYNTNLSVDERLALSDADPQDAHQSFFSGHSAMAFVTATLMSQLFTDVYGRSTTSDIVWVSSLSVASVTAYARVRAGMHYPTDVMVGAAVGTAIGLVVPRLHRVGAPAPFEVTAGPGGVTVRIAH